MCPLQELVEAAQDVFQDHEGSIQFVVNEAHSAGFTGTQGKGLVCELGLEKEIAVIMHFFGKAIGAAEDMCSPVLSSGRKLTCPLSNHSRQQKHSKYNYKRQKGSHVFDSAYVPFRRCHNVGVQGSQHER